MVFNAIRTRLLFPLSLAVNAIVLLVFLSRIQITVHPYDSAELASHEIAPSEEYAPITPQIEKPETRMGNGGEGQVTKDCGVCAVSPKLCEEFG